MDRQKLETIAVLTAIGVTAVMCCCAIGVDAEAQRQEEFTIVGTAPDDETSYGIDLTQEPQVVRFTIVPEVTPRPSYREEEAHPRYMVAKEDVETLARLLWSSPLRDESNKTKLIWCVLNRVADNTGRFGDSIQECVTVREFPFYDRKARVSDANRELVERELQRWMAYRDGYGIGYHPSAAGVFLRFVGEYNRRVELLRNIDDQEALD